MTPTHLQTWTRPAYYAGAIWPDYYVVYGRTRDSDTITESNWTVITKALTAIEPESEPDHAPWFDKPDEARDTPKPGWVIVRESHFLCGWVEWIGVHHQADPRVIKSADDMIGRIADYPILDESEWSERETAEADRAWEQASLADRLHYIRETSRDGRPVSCFTIRHDYAPWDDQGTIQDRLLGH